MRNVHPPRSLWYPWLLLLFFLFFLGSREGKAEQPADSLFKALKSLEKGPSEERIKTLLNIGRALYSSYPDSAMSYVDQAEELAIKLDHRSGLIGSANLKGVIYYVQGKYPKALPYFQRVLEMKKEEGKAAEVANIRNNLGLLHQKMGAYAEALEEHQKAYQIRDSLNRPRGIAESCNNLGIVHYQKGDMEQAEAYYRRSIRIKKENGREGDLKGAYNNLGLVLVERGQERKALKLYRKALSLARKNDDRHSKANYMINIGNAHRALGKWDTARSYYDKAKTFYKDLGNEDGTLSVLIAEAKLYHKKGEHTRAYRIALDAASLAESLSVLREKEEVVDLLARISESMGKYREAYHYIKKNRALQDSIQEAEEEKRVATIEAKFQARHQVKELREARQEAERQQERTLWVAGGGGVLLLLITGFLFYAYRQKKKANELLSDHNKKIEKQKEEKELLLQELHHRVKNNLQLILSLLNLQTSRIKDPEALEIHKDSQNRVRSMGLLHEKMYHLSELDRNQFEQFVRDLSEHLLETYGMDDRIGLELDIDADGLGTNTLTPVALILNELLSNALKYGFDRKAEGTIHVTIEPKDQDHYILEVRDNGSGFEDIKEEDKERAYGLDIVHSLAEQLEGELSKKEQEEGACLQVHFKNLD